MAGRSADIILSKDGGENWVKKNSINENDQVENIRNLFSFGDYFLHMEETLIALVKKDFIECTRKTVPGYFWEIQQM